MKPGNKPQFEDLPQVDPLRLWSPWPRTGFSMRSWWVGWHFYLWRWFRGIPWLQKLEIHYREYREWVTMTPGREFGGFFKERIGQKEFTACNETGSSLGWSWPFGTHWGKDRAQFAGGKIEGGTAEFHETSDVSPTFLKDKSINS